MFFHEAYSTLLCEGCYVRLPHWPIGMHLKSAEQESPDGNPPITVLNVVHGDKECRWRMPDVELISHDWVLFELL